jgi:hypothetical protein
MTPEEKAKELVNKFAKINLETFIYEDGLWDYKYSLEDDEAKQCALIAVDELIYECLTSGNFIKKPYWEQVREEIKKL